MLLLVLAGAAFAAGVAAAGVADEAAVTDVAPAVLVLADADGTPVLFGLTAELPAAATVPAEVDAAPVAEFAAGNVAFGGETCAAACAPDCAGAPPDGPNVVVDAGWLLAQPPSAVTTPSIQ